ncbi:MAG TPA: YHYH protein [Acidimicrobiales bacterium]|nr:YHYH protein [Acidimicrobiales bacterium]
MGARRRRIAATLTLLLTACGGGAGTPPAPTVAAAGPTTVTSPTTVATTTTVAPAPVVTLLPLGDGKRSAAPEVGSLFSCQTTFGPAAGAFRDGPWILGDGRWDPSAKLHVQGTVAWPQAEYDTRAQGATRVITTNGVPAQATTGVFPIAANDPAYQYDRNPNVITPRSTTLTVPARPAMAAAPACVNMGAIGVLTDGVALFNALDAQGRDAAAHEVLDNCDGHPERSGQYHHHEVPSCVLARATASSTLVGYALDGFGIYVERRPNGSLLTNADLDGCHGRTSPVAWDGETVDLYHYVATAEYPYTVGCYRGTPAAFR